MLSSPRIRACLAWLTRRWPWLPLGLLTFTIEGAEPLTWNEAGTYRSREVKPEGGGKAGFTAMPLQLTGVTFTNVLVGDAYVTNFVAHNGSGVAIGDVDRDGWPDLYFCNLQGPNRLYRNLGAWKFEAMDLGAAACADQLSTGATLADVDGDGDLDVLVNGVAAGTRLFLNDGHARWTEVTDSGLSRSASAMSLALADIDGDGDLDLYCAHYIDVMLLADPTSRFAIARKGDQWEVTKFNGESTRSPRWKGRFEALPGGKVRELPEVHGLYRNDGHGRFHAIEFEPGTYLDEAGQPIPPSRDWGLTPMFRDLNGDGHPDLYVCNDNGSPNRAWLNTGKGTFRAIPAQTFRHTSRSSMGIDIADVNRDGYDDILILDMLARDPARRATQQVRDRHTLAETEQAEFRPQFNRNMLFLGQPDGTFTEAALWAGVAATDWSWCPLFLDVDLDGYEDLLVTNGFEFDVMDQDSDDLIRDPRRRLPDSQLRRWLQLRPGFHTRNAAFRNRGDGSLEPASTAWGFDALGVSYGMASGDLDNDGDQDLVVNNLNQAASLYRNDGTAPRVGIRLIGSSGNTEGVGARVDLVGGTLTQGQEMVSGGHFLSGAQVMRTFAAARSNAPMRLDIRWRDGSWCQISNVQPNRVYEIRQAGARTPAPARHVPPSNPLFRDASDLLGHTHSEDPFDDWSQQALLPKRLSRLGPGVSAGDLDGDGWEDLVVAAGRGGRLTAYHNADGRAFRRQLAESPAPGDQGAVLIWADGQGNRRLLATVSHHDLANPLKSTLAVYAANDLRLLQDLPIGPASPGPLAAADLDGDGDLDLFVGGRFAPGRYPEPVASTVFINDRGRLTPDAARSEPFRSLGLVSGATFADLDGDGTPDLALAMEWGPIRVFRNRSGHFEEVTESVGLARWTGWWTSVAAGDFDGDGRLDLACGNWGRNSIYELNQPTSYRVYYGDWNHENVLGLMEAWSDGTGWHPVQTRAALVRGLPELGIRFPTHKDFARASLTELLGTNASPAAFLQAQTLDSMVFLNRGTRFDAVPLPRQAQMSPVFGLQVGDWDGDGLEDLFLAQNFFGTATDLTRDDDGRGLCLRGDGHGSFTALDPASAGIRLRGEQRGVAVADFNHDGRPDLLVGQNQGPAALFENRTARPGIRVVLRGSAANPDAVGARLRVVYRNGRVGPVRVVQAGSGYWSQNAAAPVLGLPDEPEAVWIRWPDGRETRVPVHGPATTLEVRSEP